MVPELARIFYLHDSAQSLYRLFRTLLIEYRTNQINRENLIKAMMVEFLINLQRLGLKNFTDDRHMVRDYIAHNLATGKIDYQELSKQADLSQSWLCTLFKQATGHCIFAEFCERRLSEAEKLLKTTSSNISNICFHHGFNDISYFYRKFKQRFRTTPRQIRLELKKNFN